jgi:enterochelin esterase family protein
VPIEVHRITWHGRADAVTILTFMPRFPHRVPMTLRDGVWHADLFLPAEARIEYRLEIKRGDRFELTLDPGNPEVATNPFGDNSVLVGAQYPIRAPRPSIGWRLSEFRVQSTAFGVRRHHHLLSPTGIADRELLPLVVLHDGTDYLRHASLEATLGSAIAAGQLPFLRVALVDPRHRNVEYAADPRHAAHIALEVLGRLETRIGIGSQRILGGASLGAVASWHTAWSHPRRFTGLVLQSGTFALSSHSELPDDMTRAVREFLGAAMVDPRVSQLGVGQFCGRYESLIDWNRRVAERLSSAAANHRFEERWTGHDWGAWSDTLVDGLSAALSATGGAR